MVVTTVLPFFLTLVTLSHIPRRSTRLLVNLIRTQHTHQHHVCRKHIQRLCAQEEKRRYCLWVSHCIFWRSLAFHPQLPKTESVSLRVCFLGGAHGGRLGRIFSHGVNCSLQLPTSRMDRAAKYFNHDMSRRMSFRPLREPRHGTLGFRP